MSATPVTSMSARWPRSLRLWSCRPRVAAPRSPPRVRPPPPDQAGTFDVVIANGRVVDGTGAPWFRADVGITGDRITAIGNLSSARAATRIDAAGQVVAPGFIDLLGQSEFNVLVDSRRQQDHAGHHHRDHRRGRLDRAGQRRDEGRPQGQLRLLQGHAGLADARRVLRAADEVDDRDQRGHVRGLGRAARLRDGQGRPRRHRRRDGEDEGARGGSHGAWRTGPELVAAVRSQPVLDDRRARRAGEGGGRARRHLHHAPALGGQQGVRVGRRGPGDRRARRHPDRDLAPEDRVQGQLGKDDRGPAPHRRGARRGLRVSANIYPTTARPTASMRACPSGCARAARTPC